MSGSERVLICERIGSRMPESEVVRGRTRSMPNPGVTESISSGNISPNRRPFCWGEVGWAPDESGVEGFDAFAFAEPAVRGLDILLANDSESVARCSPATNFGRCAPRAPAPFPTSCPVSRVAVLLHEPYEAEPLPLPEDLPLALLEAASRADVLGAGFRRVDGGCDAD